MDFEALFGQQWRAIRLVGDEHRIGASALDHINGSLMQEGLPNFTELTDNSGLRLVEHLADRAILFEQFPDT